MNVSTVSGLTLVEFGLLKNDTMRRRVRINQIVRDFSRKPLSESSVLDLGSLEGDFSVEMALHGAQVLGIEGRRSNIEKAKARHSMQNLKFAEDDVRNLTREKYGQFDIVLCLGILYHLDAPDCFKLLQSISEVCSCFAIIDTHISQGRDAVVNYDGKQYSGWYYTEYANQPTADEEEGKPWASIGNIRSFWPTKPSLVNAIIDAGFNSAYDCQFPAWNDIPADRIALVALKGEREKVLARQVGDEVYGEKVDEVPRVAAIKVQQVKRNKYRLLSDRMAKLFGRK